MENNIFKQSQENWVIKICTDYQAIETLLEFLENFTEIVSYFETVNTLNIESKPQDLWTIDAYFDFKPDFEDLKTQLEEIAANNELKLISINLDKVEDIDWVKEVQKNFPPIEVGNFFVYGSHFINELPKGLIPILIDPGRAFGTGEHQTTKACLQLISKIENKPEKTLDLGCGSGILAIAVAKKFDVSLVACDIDDQAVIISTENCKINNVDHLINCLLSDGLNNPSIKNQYNLIIANILANPLIEMASDIVKSLTSKGQCILSGFTFDQVDKILEIYNNLGMKLDEKIEIDGWVAVSLLKE